jgi:hypothetical protein
MLTAQRDAGVAEQFADEMREEHRRRVDLSSLSKVGEIPDRLANLGRHPQECEPARGNNSPLALDEDAIAIVRTGSV